MTNVRHWMNWTAPFALALLVAASAVACRASAGATPAAATSSKQPSAVAPVVRTAGPLSVTITSPLNEAVVNTPEIVVSGQAPPDTVVTIGDTIAVVDASGQFSATVTLDAGPNQLDIQASDPDGNEANSQLTVTYEPSS